MNTLDNSLAKSSIHKSYERVLVDTIEA